MATVTVVHRMTSVSPHVLSCNGLVASRLIRSSEVLNYRGPMGPVPVIVF